MKVSNWRGHKRFGQVPKFLGFLKASLSIRNRKNISMFTYHVDLSHGVDENDGEYCDGKTKQERPRQIPNNTPDKKIVFFSSQSKIISSHRSLTARSSMRMTAIQMKAVRNNKRRIVVLGSTRAWSPPSSRVSMREQAKEAGKPVKRELMNEKK